MLATTTRWATGAVLLGGLAWAVERVVPWAIADTSLRASVATVLWLVLSGAFWLYLRGEEARLARELRIARTGTSVQRRTLLRRRRPAPYFGLAMFWYAAVRVVGVLASTTVGYAAVLLAEGDGVAAEGALGGIGASLSSGALKSLRAVVQADAWRLLDTADALSDAIKVAYATPPFAQLEPERYRIHVLVKALLQQGDDATARAVAEDLKETADEELRVYVVWLRTWFEWTHLDRPTEAETRLAILLARTQGAHDLVVRLEALLHPPAPMPAGGSPQTDDGQGSTAR